MDTCLSFSESIKIKDIVKFKGIPSSAFNLVAPYDEVNTLIGIIKHHYRDSKVRSIVGYDIDEIELGHADFGFLYSVLLLVIKHIYLFSDSTGRRSLLLALDCLDVDKIYNVNGLYIEQSFGSFSSSKIFIELLCCFDMVEGSEYLRDISPYIMYLCSNSIIHHDQRSKFKVIWSKSTLDASRSYPAEIFDVSIKKGNLQPRQMRIDRRNVISYTHMCQQCWMINSLESQFDISWECSHYDLVSFPLVYIDCSLLPLGEKRLILTKYGEGEDGSKMMSMVSENFRKESHMKYVGPFLPTIHIFWYLQNLRLCLSKLVTLHSSDEIYSVSIKSIYEHGVYIIPSLISQFNLGIYGLDKNQMSKIKYACVLAITSDLRERFLRWILEDIDLDRTKKIIGSINTEQGISNIISLAVESIVKSCHKYKSSGIFSNYISLISFLQKQVFNET